MPRGPISAGDLIAKRRNETLYMYYLQKRQNQSELGKEISDYKTTLQRNDGGMALFFDGVLPGPTAATSSESTPYTLDEAVLLALEDMLIYVAQQNLGPTRTSRFLYLWFFTVTAAYSWVSSTARITGTKDAWDWDVKHPLSSESDIFVWVNHALVECMPSFIPGYTGSTLLSNELAALGYTQEERDAAVARVRDAADWTAFQSAWTTWWSGRSADGATAAAAVPSPIALTNGTQTLNVATTTDDPNSFAHPDLWVPLVVDGRTRNYLTYNWNDVRSTVLSGAQETTIKAAGQSEYPNTSERQEEVADLVAVNGSLTDTQKVIAEFWAGGPTTVSPPGMFIWMWKLFVELQQTAHTRSWDAFFYSGLELAIHLFETGRLVWGLKKANMQARPIQEIRRLYRGQNLQTWNGSTVAGEAWVPYQASNFVTPPFADFPSGHSAFSQSFANVMSRWFGASIPVLPTASTSDLYLLSPLFTGRTEALRFGSWTIPQGTSEVQPGTVPATDITLSWTTWQDLADSAGISRQYGGIHCISAHTGSVALANALSTELIPAWSISLPT